DDVLDGQRLVHREAEVRVPAEGTEPVEVVNHRSDDRVDVLLDVLQESTAAEEVVVVGVRLATVVTRRRTGALADAVVLDEADTFEPADLAAADQRVVDVLLRDTPPARPGLLAEIVDHVRVNDRDVELVVPRRDVVGAERRDDLTDVSSRQIVAAGERVLRVAVSGRLGDASLDGVLHQLVDDLASVVRDGAGLVLVEGSERA